MHRQHDVDVEAAPKENNFIPHLLRTEMPLKCSKTVKKDDHYDNNLNTITTLMEKARKRHEQYKIDMSASAQAIAKEELAARMNILGCQYADTILGIADKE